MSLIHYGNHVDQEPPSIRKALSLIFGGYIRRRSSVDYVCPKCRAELTELRLYSGGIWLRDGRPHSKMTMICGRCGCMHTAKLSGNKAVHVFMSLQGTAKIKKLIASEIKRLQETSKSRSAGFSALNMVDYPKTEYGKELSGK